MPHKTCSRCEVLPAALPDSGRLYLSPPIEPTRHTMVSCFDQLGLPHREIYTDIYEVDLGRGDLDRLCDLCCPALTDMEKADTRCFIVPEDQSFDVRLLMNMQPLSRLIARMEGQWLIELMAAERLETWFQPIVHADDPSKVFAQECLVRVRHPDGRVYPPGDIFRIARDGDLLFHLDRLCRMTAIRFASAHGIACNIFINFNPSTIYDPEYCLQTTVAAIEAAAIPHDRIVFEIVESDDIKDTAHLINILNFYRRHGYRVAMDDLGAGYSSLNLLSKLRPDFIKLDMELVRYVDEDPYKAIIASNLIRLARELEVRIIAEGVERPEEWAWLKRQKADFLQGFLFARPGLPPPTPQVPQ